MRVPEAQHPAIWVKRGVRLRSLNNKLLCGQGSLKHRLGISQEGFPTAVSSAEHENFDYHGDAPLNSPYENDVPVDGVHRRKGFKSPACKKGT